MQLNFNDETARAKLKNSVLLGRSRLMEVKSCRDALKCVPTNNTFSLEPNWAVGFWGKFL
jgi:hypothetical protein